ncbi:MAG: ABC transporter ATP-binding protein [Alphaproteobacteria bacterium]|nr:ABC transporter ATP-binding protein [Alphaproteobacteria bacterium]
MIQLGHFFELHDVRKEYVLRRGLLQRLTRRAPKVAAVDGVSLSIERGTIFGLVGESGCGKSTLAQIMVRLIEPTAGKVVYRGADVARLRGEEERAYRHAVQMVFQDSGSSLNPRKRIRRVLAEALSARGVGGAAARSEIATLMRQVGLDTALLHRFPHELSGGQRQRVGIARALAMKPEVLVADEPVSALDVSLQGQIINLLCDLNRELGLTIVLISHDLAVVARACTQIGVMNAGKIVERGTPQQVLFSPVDPFTRQLLASVPRGLAGRHRRLEPDISPAEKALRSVRQPRLPADEIGRQRSASIA